MSKTPDDLDWGSFHDAHFDPPEDEEDTEDFEWTADDEWARMKDEPDYYEERT